MKVKCISIPGIQNDTVSSPWIKAGNEYVVLSIYENSQGEKYYRIAPHADGGSESLGLFLSHAFEVVDDAWPPTWVQETVNGDISIAPKAWQRLGFWEEFYDGDRQAEDVYKEEKDKILKYEN